MSYSGGGLAGRRPHNEWTKQPLDRVLEPGGGLRRQGAGRAEEVLEEGDQQDDDQSVQQRSQERRSESETEPTATWSEVAKEAAFSPHCQARLGVSKAIGNTTSSGDTPPWRNAPRYRAWYSRSFVG